ncbi:MAG: hypothetical protein JJE04_20795 [Acidobacteriia bacterium]|nr:hypothetical protein [Terriglobia bacterium]
MKFAAVCALCAFCIIPARAHETISTKLTWTREISRILYKHCGSCHKEGGPSFSLMSYEEARPWAKAIKEEVLERRMPPWSAVKGFGEFAHDEALSMEDLHLISDWVEGGAPQGDPKYLPDAPRYKDAPKPRLIQGRVVSGEYKLRSAMRVRAVRPEGLAEGGWLKAIAVLPDGRVEPLLWIYNYQQKWPRNYTFQDAIALPAGAAVQVAPAGAKLVLSSR